MSVVKKPTHEATIVPEKPWCECDELCRKAGVRCNQHPGKQVIADGKFRFLEGLINGLEAWLCRDCIDNTYVNYVRVQ